MKWRRRPGLTTLFERGWPDDEPESIPAYAVRSGMIITRTDYEHAANRITIRVAEDKRKPQPVFYWDNPSA